MASIPIRNRIRSVVGGLFRRPMIRAKDRFLQLAKTSCRAAQHRTLQRLLRLNAGSDFCRDHGLVAGLSAAEFRGRVPVTDFETFRPYIERMQAGQHSALLGSGNRLLMYAVTSGTTSEPKLIPLTRRFVADYRRGWQNWGVAVIQQHPPLKLLRMVQITSNHQRFRTQDGTPCGNISGLVAAMQKAIVRRLYTVPAAVSGIDDPAAKRYAVARFAFADPWVGMLITANPSTLLQLVASASDDAESLIRDIHDGSLSCSGVPSPVTVALQRSLRPDAQRAAELQRIVSETGSLSPEHCWPHLTQLGVWTGGSAAAYSDQLQQTFGPITVRDHGLHASEGRMTIPFEDNTASGVLDIESHYFEFLPVAEAESTSPVVLEAQELQPGADYFILLTTSSGFCRYNIFDVVRCTGFFGTTPLLEFRHKGSHISSITGEKITESQVVEAVHRATRQCDVMPRQFTLTPVWSQPPGYQLYVADAQSSPASGLWSVFAEQVDIELRKINCEYDEKRATQRLAAVRCEWLPETAWQTFAETRLAASGGSPEQYKHPCLLPDSKFERCFATAAGL
ncbi:MAG: GH3 auxin-responsive promoter family protein [Planctomycetaceae bacterium]